jgi:hypothetical protein
VCAHKPPLERISSGRPPRPTGQRRAFHFTASFPFRLKSQ